MPARYEIDVEQGVIFTFYWGVVKPDELLSMARTRLADPRHRPHFCTLADISGVEAFDMGFNEVMGLVESYRVAASGATTGRIAFYAPRKDAVYGAVRQFQEMAGTDGRMRVFTDFAEARAWVGLPPA